MRITLLFAVFTLISVALSAQEQKRGAQVVEIMIDGVSTSLYDESHALIIGISSYNNGWSALSGVKTDVTEVKKALEQNGFNVEVLHDPTKEQIDKTISSFINRYGQKTNNRLLFYLAGHGHTIKTNYGDILGYFVSVDAPSPQKDRAGFQEKSVEMAQIEIYAKRIQSKHAIFVFDACFAGSLFDMRSATSEAISYKTVQHVRQFITSGSADEKVPDESIFRKEFVKAITTDDADYDKDGYITGSELGFFLQNKVVNYSYNTQHPQYGKIRNPNLDKGDFVFVIPKGKAATPQPAGATGSIQLITELTGKFYIDGVFYQEVMAGSTYTFNNIQTGIRVINIIGSVNWTEKVMVFAGQPTVIRAKEELVVTIARVSSDTLTDSRDGKIYKTVKIGTQIWMAENLNYKTGNSWCYDNNTSNCTKYGRLYDWNTAEIACPSGWHLPGDAEWSALSNFVGSNGGVLLKSSAGWDHSGNGTDSYGFTALPGGYRHNVAVFDDIGSGGYWWSSTESYPTFPYYWSMNYNDSKVRRNDYGMGKAYGFSVRCLKDN